VPADTVAVVSTGLAPDTEYALRVVAMNGFGRSTASDPAMAQTTTASMQFFAGMPSGNNGQFTSIVVEPGGREHIAHYDVANSNVLYTTRLFPTSYVTMTVDSGPTGVEDVGGDGTAIAVDPAGKVHIAAHDRTTDRPRYLTNATGPWTKASLDSIPAGAQPRMACHPSTGEVHLSYLDSTDLGTPRVALLRYTRKLPGGTWRTPEGTTYDQTSVRHSLALHGSGDPFQFSFDQRKDLRVYLGQGGSGSMTWSPYPAVPPPLSPPQIDDTAMAVDELGRIHVAFHEKSTGTLYAASYDSGWVLELVDQSEGVDLGSFCALAVQPSTQRLHLAYYDATRKDLRYARKDPGGPWVRRIIEAVGEVGSHASIAVDGTGKVYIAYRDETNRRLRVAVGTP